jgi:hypothetical protein
MNHHNDNDQDNEFMNILSILCKKHQLRFIISIPSNDHFYFRNYWRLVPDFSNIDDMLAPVLDEICEFDLMIRWIYDSKKIPCQFQENFYEYFLQNTHLIGFNDGVYDTIQKKFDKYHKSDQYLVLSIGMSYQKLFEVSIDEKEIFKTCLSNVFVKKRNVEKYLKRIAECLIIQRPKERKKMILLTGNEKTARKFLILIKNTFHHYFVSAETSAMLDNNECRKSFFLLGRLFEIAPFSQLPDKKITSDIHMNTIKVVENPMIDHYTKKQYFHVIEFNENKHDIKNNEKVFMRILMDSLK